VVGHERLERFLLGVGEAGSILDQNATVVEGMDRRLEARRPPTDV
jgi:hypothetical protein